MSKLVTRDFRCKECGEEWYETVFRELEDTLMECPECAQLAGVRTLSSPTVLRASYLDGQSRGEGYENMKKAAKLDKEMCIM